MNSKEKKIYFECIIIIIKMELKDNASYLKFLFSTVGVQVYTDTGRV